MPINMTLRIADAWRRCGVRRLPSPHRFTDSEWRLQHLRGARLGVWFSWSNAWKFVRLRAWGSGPDGNEVEFGRGERALQAAYAELGVPADLPADFFARHEVIAGIVPRDGRVRLLFCVDSDAEEFREAFTRLGSGRRQLTVTFGASVFDSDSDEEEQGAIRLEVEPGELPSELDGFLAVDLGNTTCTVAVHEGKLLGSKHLLIVDGEAAGGCTDAPEAPPRPDRAHSSGSAVRIDVVDRELEQRGFRDHPACFVWDIGARALMQPSTDGVVLGAKRQLAAVNFNENESVHAWTRRNFGPGESRDPVPLPRRLPAELLLCRLFQRFREGSLFRLPQLAVTYPTSYSRREIDQLREGACRAIARQNAKLQSEEGLGEAAGLVHRLIDEASAAAFFFLFRDIVETPPGLLRFRYLYPLGQNLLLYDCGGGTTDIALVRASTDRRHPNLLNVEVRGRSGVRDFGGDDLTIAVFRLLKAAIAARAQEARGMPVTVRLPQDGAEALAKLLNDRAADIDRVVPTMYNRRRMHVEDRRHRDHTRHLWQRALAVKHQLEKGGEETTAQAFAREETFDDPLSKALVAGLASSAQQRLWEGLRGIKIRRKDVDALVRDSVMRSVRRCNQLIRRCLVQGAKPPEEVHRLVLLGNGSRYPLVQELLRANLDVPFYDDRLLFDRDNLKTAVAKGAALALGTELAALDIRVHFDWSTADRLPYDVGAQQYGKGGVARWLFREGERFDEIEGRQEEVDVLAIEQGGKATTLQLVRRWPGDTEAERYLLFEFPYGVEGKVTVEYDPTQDFRVSDSATGNPGRLVGQGDPDTYLHPVERGTL